MHIFAQHTHSGYLKGDLVDRGLTGGCISGVVMSSTPQGPDRLLKRIADLRAEYGEHAILAVDPQLYVSVVISSKEGSLPQYDYYESGLTRFNLSEAKIREIIEKSVRYQSTLYISRIIGPSVRLADFGDAWSLIALNFARALPEVCASASVEIPALASFIFDINALKSPAAIREFLNEVTLLPVHGFYLLVDCTGLGDRQKPDADVLANLMRIVNVLAEHNDYEVVVGYTDFDGLLLHAVGAFGTGVGWFKSTRHFSMGRFEDSGKGGGWQQQARYTSGLLMTRLSVATELASIAKVGRLSEVISDDHFDETLVRSEPRAWVWQNDTDVLHRWQVLSTLADQVSRGSTMENLDVLEHLVRQARHTYEDLQSTRGVALDSRKHPGDVEVWLRAIEAFRKGPEI